MEFPRRLRSLRWEAYPRKSLPPAFHPEYLVELIMRESQLQKLWEGTQPLTNLKKMDLEGSCHLKELPDLSKATNLERLLQVVPNLNLASLEMVDMDGCSGLRSFPDISRNITTLVIAYTSVEELSASSIRLLSRLCHLDISGSRNLKTLTVAKSILLSLFTYHNSGCYNSPPLKERNVLVAPPTGLKTPLRSELRRLTSSDTTCNAPTRPRLMGHPRPLSRPVGPIPSDGRSVNFSKGSKSLFTDPAITTRPFPVLWPHSHAIANHFPIGHPSFHYSSSSTLNSGVLSGCAPEKVKSVTHLDLSYTSIEMIPDCIKCLHGLQHLYLAGCRKLRSLPELPISLMTVLAEGCESLVAVSCFLDTPNAQLNLSSCFKLSREARRAIIQQRFLRGWGCLPGRKIPAEFSHRGEGDHLVISTEGKSPFSVSSGFQVCLVISPNQHTGEGMFPELLCHRIGRSGWPVENLHVYYIPTFRTEHMFIFQSELLDKDRCLDVDNEILFQFSCEFHDIIECGIRINADEAVKSSGEDDDCSYEYEHSEASECTEKYDTTFGLTCDKVSKEEEDNARGNNHTDCWNWIVLCFDISDILRNFGRLVWERVQPNHDAFKTKDKIHDEEEATDQSNVLDDFTI
ncbi:hypothetical protein YC2023_046442 [Brassica napus]